MQTDLQDLLQDHCQETGPHAQKLGEPEVRKWQQCLQHWQWHDTYLKRELIFEDFKSLMSFVNQLAALAEAENHHPDFDIRYNRLLISLSTHSAHGITRNDIILAAHIDSACTRWLHCPTSM